MHPTLKAKLMRLLRCISDLAVVVWYSSVGIAMGQDRGNKTMGILSFYLDRISILTAKRI